MLLHFEGEAGVDLAFEELAQGIYFAGRYAYLEAAALAGFIEVEEDVLELAVRTLLAVVDDLAPRHRFFGAVDVADDAALGDDNGRVDLRSDQPENAGDGIADQKTKVQRGVAEQGGEHSRRDGPQIQHRPERNAPDRTRVPRHDGIAHPHPIDQRHHQQDRSDLEKAYEQDNVDECGDGKRHGISNGIRQLSGHSLGAPLFGNQHFGEQKGQRKQ